MGYTVVKVEGQGGAGDQIKVLDENRTETIFDDVNSAADYVKEESEWLEEALDNAEYGEEVDLDALHAEEDEEEESGEGESA